MKHYFRRLRKAICGRNYYQYYYEDKYPLVWELDNYIINLVRVNLPNYTLGFPNGLTQDSWDLIKKEIIELANKLSNEWDNYWVNSNGDMDYNIQQYKKDTERFSELIGKYLFYLRD